MLTKQNAHLKINSFLCLIAVVKTLIEYNQIEYIDYVMANVYFITFACIN